MPDRRLALAAILAGMALLAAGPAAGDGTEVQTRWIMGTTLTIHLPADRDRGNELASACFALAQQWDDLLSPWQDDAPLTRLSRGAGQWVVVPAPLLEYLDRARIHAERSGGLVDITLTWRGARALELDSERGRARIPAGARALDPGADGKGVALDAMAAILDTAGVISALLDFGGSSFLARGHAPDGTRWTVAVTGPDGRMVGTLRLHDTAVSVSSTIQRRQETDGTASERHHLLDLRTGTAVTAPRTAVVLAPSATEAEVLSTALAIAGPEAALLGAFPGCAVAIFGPGDPVFHGGFEAHFTPLD